MTLQCKGFLANNNDKLAFSISHNKNEERMEYISFDKSFEMLSIFLNFERIMELQY